MENRVKLTVENGIAEVTLNRPDKMNALDGAMFDAINATIEDIAGRDDITVVVLAGEGRAFSAGIDLEYLASGAGISNLTDRTHGDANRVQQPAWGWRSLPQPVIAAVHGVAFGGGLQIALGADIRIAHPATRLAVMEARWGLVPDMSAFPLLRENVRGDWARELVYTGKQISGTLAAEIGLVTRTAEEPLAEARTLATEIANSSQASLAAAKRIFRVALEDYGTAREVLLAESVEQEALLATDEPANRLAAHFAGN